LNFINTVELFSVMTATIKLMSLFTELLIIISNPHYYDFLRTENMNTIPILNLHYVE